jgi:predicted nuclease of restriction endonuclease-like (RecB) superfamily
MNLESSHINFIKEIKSQIKSAQYRALQKVNKEQIKLYWNIGKTILERQQQFGWGKGIVELLATELQKEFIGIQGFSARNLWRMRTLYEQYIESNLILPPLVAEIPWTHNILILEKCKDEHERFYYINMTKKFQWSKTLLINAIENQHYQNTLLNQNNFSETLNINVH